MKIIVGLGNPGREYAGTRHNVGWQVVDSIACRLGWISRPGEFERMARSKFDGLTLDGNVSLGSGSEKLLLLKPMTYMNLSGRAVQAAMAFYQLSPPEILVVLDDMALPSGRIRLRPGGSSGGHNGLRDIERVLGTSQYPRLRLGIDAPPANVAGRDYVLSAMSPEQRVVLEQAVSRATAAAMAWFENGVVAAMNDFNVDVDRNDDKDVSK